MSKTELEEVNDNKQKKSFLKDRMNDTQSLRSVIIILAILAVLGLIYIHLMSPERWTISMDVNGSSEQILYQGDKYVEEGCTAQCKNDRTGIVRTLAVKTDGRVDTKKTGTYTITYTAGYFGQTASKERIVKVVDSLEAARKASMYDTFTSGETAPVIGLYGGKNLTVYDIYGFEDGYVATDESEGYVTDRVQVTGQVDTGTPGEYRLNYSVTDQDGQVTTAERLVTVKNFQPPVIRELEPDEKIIYLTFDDGPGKYTEQILSILEKYHVKVTFFVTSVVSDKKYLELIGKEAELGHAVGVHSKTHNYSQIYSNDQAFWDDFNAMNKIIEEKTGHKSEIMRFPGGSSNTVSKKYCPGIMTRLASEAVSQGYWYFDWNVMSGDAGNTKDSNVIFENMKEGVLKNARSIILCHDTHDYTMNALEPFLQWALSNGYSFDILRNGDYAAHQSINN